MQIVQKLAGYTLGRADLVRRAMSKKKAAVMQQERQNLYMEMKRKAYLGVFPEVSRKMWQIRSMMI